MHNKRTEGEENLGKIKKFDPNLKIPDIIFAEASVRPAKGPSLLEISDMVTVKNVSNFRSDPKLAESAVQRLRKVGFDVLFVSPTSINISGPPELYTNVFKTTIAAEERPTVKALREQTVATFLDSPDTAVSGLIDTSKSALADVLAGVAINEPVYFFGNPFPPSKAYWHLNVPSDVSMGLNADRAHRDGYTGKGIKVVMVDSGWYRHPFFVGKGYHANPVVLGPGTKNPDHDEHGHGTGESANIFSVAPDVEFTMVKMSFVNSVGAFNKAVSLKPNIISCSWGSSKRYARNGFSAPDQALAAAIANAVDQGITVVFSAGNGQFGFPGQHPDVISAGGVYMNSDGSFEATPYASGFRSTIYRGREVPDVCGLVGLPPHAQYIMLPVEDNDFLDKYMSGGTYPMGDETADNDGWAAFSGTSAAAPQLAGICALIRQACNSLDPATIRSILKKTARDVTKGSCSPITGSHPAGPGPDLATGCGLADAHRAVLLARYAGIISGLMKETLITENKFRTLEKIFTTSQDLSMLDNQKIADIKS